MCVSARACVCVHAFLTLMYEQAQVQLIKWRYEQNGQSSIKCRGLEWWIYTSTPLHVFMAWCSVTFVVAKQHLSVFIAERHILGFLLRSCDCSVWLSVSTRLCIWRNSLLTCLGRPLGKCYFCCVDGGLLGCDILWTCMWLTTFRRNILPPFSGLKWTLKMEEICSSELLVPTYKSTPRHNPEDCHWHLHCHENLKFHLCFCCISFHFHETLAKL
jgi:hypothetical protein